MPCAHTAGVHDRKKGSGELADAQKPTAKRSTTVIIGAVPNDNHGHSLLVVRDGSSWGDARCLGQAEMVESISVLPHQLARDIVLPVLLERAIIEMGETVSAQAFGHLVQKAICEKASPLWMAHDHDIREAQHDVHVKDAIRLMITNALLKG